MNEEAEEKSSKLWWGLALVAILGIWIFWQHILTIFGIPVTDSSMRGEFGDSYGGLTALFTALAFFGVILTARLQGRELELQRKELADTRAVMHQQAASISKQTFEATFFQMLRMQLELRESLRLVFQSPKPEEGANTFDPYLKLLNARLQHMGTSAENATLGQLTQAFDKLYWSADASLGPYYRNLYHLLKMIDRSTLSPSDKTAYANLVRAQLGAFELALLFYDGLSSVGAGMKPLIEYFGLLKHMRVENLLHKAHKQHYSPSAFLSSEDRASYGSMPALNPEGSPPTTL